MFGCLFVSLKGQSLLIGIIIASYRLGALEAKSPAEGHIANKLLSGTQICLSPKPVLFALSHCCLPAPIDQLGQAFRRQNK